MSAPIDVRLNDTELAALRKFRTVHGGAERRRHVRHSLPENFPLALRLTAPGSSNQAFSASARDISTSGMGFYYTAYIHLGTTCRVFMKTLKGDAVALPSTVVRCRHVSGRIHEVGVLFEHEIDIGQFVQGGTVPATRAAEDAIVRVSDLVQELQAMIDQRAAMSGILSKVAELAVLLAPFHAPDEPPAPAPANPPDVAAAPAPAAPAQPVPAASHS